MNIARRLLKPTTTTLTTINQSSVIKRLSSNSAHEENHEAITRGYLFGRPPGEKVAMEYWEPVWYFGYYGVFAALIAGHFIFYDNTTMADRAKIEAHKRMAQKGERFGWPLPPDYALVSIVEGEEPVVESIVKSEDESLVEEE